MWVVFFFNFKEAVMKTKSSFPGEVSVHTIPHQPSAGVNILMAVSTCGSANVQALHKACVYTDTYKLSSTLPGEMGRKIQNFIT